GDAVEGGTRARGQIARRPRAVGQEPPVCARQLDRRHGSALQLGNVDPAPLGPALEAELGELDAFGPREQIPAEGSAFHDVPDVELPLRLEAVGIGLGVRYLLPLGEEVVATQRIRVPYRLRRRLARLDPAAREPGQRRAARAVELEGDEIVAPHARAP